MTFSFDINLGDDVSKVRFELADTEQDANWLEDETIQAQLGIQGTFGGAVIACVEYIIAQLSMPDFKLDWLSESNASARAAWDDVLDKKRAKFGIGQVTGTAVQTYRVDSYQTDGDSYSEVSGAF